MTALITLLPGSRIFGKAVIVSRKPIWCVIPTETSRPPKLQSFMALAMLTLVPVDPTPADASRSNAASWATA